MFNNTQNKKENRNFKKTFDDAEIGRKKIATEKEKNLQAKYERDIHKKITSLSSWTIENSIESVLIKIKQKPGSYPPECNTLGATVKKITENKDYDSNGIKLELKKKTSEDDHYTYYRCEAVAVWK